MSLPYAEPLTLRSLDRPVVPEPPRRGEVGGEPCRICQGRTREAVWSDELWTLHPPSGCSLPGTLWLASREHADSFADLSPRAAADFGRIAARVERAVLRLGDVARVHLYRWGDGGAHFHVWFMPRPLGMLQAQGAYLPIWEDAMPNVPDEESERAARRVADFLDREGCAQETPKAPPRRTATGPPRKTATAPLGKADR